MFTRLNSLLSAVKMDETGNLPLSLSVARYWSVCVGSEISRKTSIKYLKKGVLFIAAENAAWASHLTLIKDEILDKLNEQMKPCFLNDIRFSAASHVIRERVQQKNTKTLYALTDSEKSDVKNAAAMIEDEGLRILAEKIFAGSIIRNKSR